ncbi:DUF262 domain-containing protein [Azospirillum brasilense]|uniref:DUF262 domain-containing protein n=1 Tax=Azospirillum brasilense TaxID=192 RepID=UPI00190DB435|nr:DUF262 domain-containing protein [Azospirillum brasilense]MBK3735583.1 DUF262 domain-containing protein [Azospirillum brasilense]
MQTPLNASASSAGALLSSSTFEIPPFQREYSWGKDEVGDFWGDLCNNINEESYFLGLIILTDRGGRKYVVDGQQRLVTLTLLANALYHEALTRGRKALADRIQADFLRSIDYSSDDTDPRIIMTDAEDNCTLQYILSNGKPPDEIEGGTVSDLLADSFSLLRSKLREDLKVDPFKRLGKWTEFLTNRVYFAVFIHPDSATAYQVYEVINTRGKELTTADLLKNYIISQVGSGRQDEYYERWKFISKQFESVGVAHFVQYIRHVVTVRNGHILPKDLFKFLAQRTVTAGKAPPSPVELMDMLEQNLPLYMQMVDPTLAGPADAESLKIFSALSSLGVIAVRPILLALAQLPNGHEGMRYILRLVVRRIIVGNLGTGNVERKFGEAARKVSDGKDWCELIKELDSLNPDIDDFINQLRKRSFNKGVLAFMRRSILARSITPECPGTLHFIWTGQAPEWCGMSEEEGYYWSSTIGNTFLSRELRRDKRITDWDSFKEIMLPEAIPNEWVDELSAVDEWNANSIEMMGTRLAQVAGEIWY